MGDDQQWTENPAYEAADWQENPAYEAADWQENAVYQPAPDGAEDPGLDGVAALFPSETRMAIDAAMHARGNQELKPIDDDNPMEVPDAMKGYVASTLGTRRDWDSLSDEERRNEITGSAGAAAAQVHPGLAVSYVNAKLDPGTAGQTDPWTGRVDTDASGFSGDELTADTVNTIYHETTHAEQVALVRDVAAQGGAVTDRDVYITYEMGTNLGTSIQQPEPGTTLEVEKLAGEAAGRAMQGQPPLPGDDAADAAYHALRAEQEAHSAGDAAGRMFERVSGVHDELEDTTRDRRAAYDREAEQRADQALTRQNFAELPQGGGDG